MVSVPKNKKKCFTLIGSALLCCFVIPMYSFVSNYPQFNLVDTLLITAIFLGIFACIAIPLGFIFKNVGKVSFLIYGIGIIFWFSYPLAVSSHRFCPKFIVKSGYHWFLLSVCCLLAVICLSFIARYLRSLVINTNKFLTIFTLLVSTILSVEGCWKIFSSLKNITSTDSTHGVLNKKQYPNVYHILLDAHPNQKAMEIIGGGLQPFYRELEQLGFVTFPESRSNYPCTSLSVTSMLDMDYLPKDVSISFINNKRHNSKVFNEFKRYGYRILLGTDNRMIRSLYGKTDGDIISNSSLLVQLYSLLIQTPVKHTFENVFSGVFRSACINAIEGVFESLKRCRNTYGSNNNVFYTHVLCPHEPCIFSKRAKNRSFSGFLIKFNTSHLSTKETHQAYCENVYGIDALVLKWIKEILRQYEAEAIKPIIVLHGDHSILYNGRNDLSNPFITADTVYGNLLALYVPKEWEHDAKDLTFINLYRWIFNHLFGTNYLYFKENRQIN